MVWQRYGGSRGARRIAGCLVIAAILVLGAVGCRARTESMEESSALTEMSDDTNTAAEEGTKDTMQLSIGETTVPVTWEENASVDALRALCPRTVEMSMYGGFEQVGDLGQSIVRDDHRITTSPGDIVLYAGDQIVIFYGSNSWAYTRLGHIDLPEEELTELLGRGNVIVRLECSDGE